jgi:hypothetical protein
MSYSNDRHFDLDPPMRYNLTSVSVQMQAWGFFGVAKPPTNGQFSGVAFGESNGFRVQFYTVQFNVTNAATALVEAIVFFGFAAA